MAELKKSRCFNHADREAVARCPECRRFFCRECVTEHAGRVICATCLHEKATEEAPERVPLRQRLSALFVPLRAAAGLFFLWMLFYAAGRILLMIPDSFHNGDFWRLP